MRVKIIKTETHVLKNAENETVFEEKNGKKFAVYKDGAEDLEEKINKFIEEIIEHDLLEVLSIQYQTASGGGDECPFVEYTAMITYK